jgi:hypothetical protein
MSNKNDVVPDESGDEPLCHRSCPSLRTLGGGFFCSEGNHATEPTSRCLPKLLSVYRCARAIAQRHCWNCKRWDRAVAGGEPQRDGFCSKLLTITEEHDYCRLGWELRTP